MRLARKLMRDRNATSAYGPAAIDPAPAADTLAEAERALREGDAGRAEVIYLRALDKLGPLADPTWHSDEAADARIRAQCHARLAAIAFDQQDFDRSLRETSLAASARHEAIGVDRCTGDDIWFMITAVVHSATVQDRIGSHREALESSAVALEFARFARTHYHDPATRRSLVAAQRAAARLHGELTDRQAGSDEPEPPGPDVTRDVIGAVMRSDLHRGSDAAAHHELVIDLTDGAVDPSPSTAPAVPDAIDLVDAATQAEAEPAAAPILEDEGGREDEGDDDRFARPARQDERRARAEAGPIEVALEPDDPSDREIPARIEDRRQDGAGSGESAAQLVGRSRGEALLARVLQSRSDSGAAINAHRAVRTATRARQWAKEDPSAMPLVALNLIEALVTRADVLAGTGHDEVARSDLRRARAIAEQLWQACPSATSATASVLVALRSASLDAKAGLRQGHLDQLDLARAIVEESAQLDQPRPDVLSEAGQLLDPADPVIGGDQLAELGDRLLDHLQAQEGDIDQVAAPVG